MPRERRKELRADLVARLKRVRGEMTDAEFDELVDDVERTADRFAEIDAGWPTPSRESRVKAESARQVDGDAGESQREAE